MGAGLKFTFFQLYEVFPWLMSRIPGPHQKTLSHFKFIYDLVKEEIEKHKENQSLHEPRDFIDYYLLQLKRSKNEPSNTYDEDNLAACIVDFFIAGTETSATTLQWALLYITNHPDVQDEVYKEIQTNCSSGLICYQDRKKLPYTNAVIHEILRINYILSFGARICLGEQIARMEIFLVFTNLLRNFRFQLPRGVKRLSEEPMNGLTVHPHSYKICAIPRHNA
ncbi:PREDICTED: cytochrome P450 2J6-like, partial [Thamnophis sirtalis]|uniref:Cytochrome P450 2J6-like n=1 Tax=Thamnophis sirtalis TaxID=35019 RepID=A0A6I9Z199_9SAUR